MLRVASFAEFSKEVAKSTGLKFTLAWLTFAGIVTPAALLMSLGVPETVVLPAVAVLIVPFQYACFCMLRSPQRSRTLEIEPRISDSHTTEAQLFSFASDLRDYLRRDAKILLVQGIGCGLETREGVWHRYLAAAARNTETRDLMFQAALSNYMLVFSRRGVAGAALETYLEAVADLQSAALRNPDLTFRRTEAAQHAIATARFGSIAQQRDSTLFPPVRMLSASPTSLVRS